jgi:hypothetical protein
VREDFRGLRLRESVVHRSVQVIGQLRRLTRRDQRADGDETPIAGRQIGTPPQIPRQDVRGLLNDARGDDGELFADPLGPFSFRRLVERQQLNRCRRDLIGSNSALREYIPRRAHGAEGIGPPGVEREVGDDLRDLAWLDAVLDRLVEVVG